MKRATSKYRGAFVSMSGLDLSFMKAKPAPKKRGRPKKPVLKSLAQQYAEIHGPRH